MKTSTWYLILIVIDIILIIMWPIVVFTAVYPAWAAFLVGALWCSDMYDLGRHISRYGECKILEKLEDKNGRSI